MLQTYDDLYIMLQTISFKCPKIKGDWLNDEKHGHGIYYWKKSGNHYDGTYVNDKKQGHGIFYYQNGDRYEGEWKSGVFEGRGSYIHTEKKQKYSIL